MSEFGGNGGHCAGSPNLVANDPQPGLTLEVKKRASGTLVDCSAERQKRPRKRAAGIAEIKMRKTLATILCSALIAASLIQAAAAAEHHHARKASRKPVMVNDQHRNSNNEQPRDSNVGGTCGLFPGPCQ
jgi:hypothetical protein